MNENLFFCFLLLKAEINNDLLCILSSMKVLLHDVCAMFNIILISFCRFKQFYYVLIRFCFCVQHDDHIIFFLIKRKYVNMGSTMNQFSMQCFNSNNILYNCLCLIRLSGEEFHRGTKREKKVK